MGSTDSLQECVDILSKSTSLVLGTCFENMPHTSFMGFLYNQDLNCIYMASPTNSRKWRNLEHNNYVSLLITDAELNDKKTIVEEVLTIEGKKESFEESDLLAMKEISIARKHRILNLMNKKGYGLIKVKILSLMLVDIENNIFYYKC